MKKIVFCSAFILSFCVVNAQMNLDRKNVDVPLICGHRGGFYPEFSENSLSMINHVKNQTDPSSLFLEIDIRQSKNGTLYIMHDESVDRTTNGKGNIAYLSDDYIDQLFLKSATGNLSKDKVFKLTDLLDTLKDSNVSLMLDIKSSAWKETAELVMRKGWASKCLFLSFKPEDTQRVISMSDQLYVSVLIRNEEDLQKVKSYPVSTQHFIAYVERGASTDFVTHLKENGLKIMADVSEHTTNSGKLYSKEYYQQRLKDQRLDVLITDFPIEVSNMMK